MIKTTTKPGDYYLTRLRRLVRLRHNHDADLNDAGARLVWRAVSATYADCADLGLRSEAIKVLEQEVA